MSSTGAPTRKASRFALVMRSRRLLRRSGIAGVGASLILREPQDERTGIAWRKRKRMRLRSLLAFSCDRDGEEGFQGHNIAVPAEAGYDGIGGVARDGASSE